MTTAPQDLPPPTRLALAHAPAKLRKPFAVLLGLDSRFASIVGTASEPMFGQLKLAWWRDSISASVSIRPKGEPLLAALSDIDDARLDKAASELVDAWEILLASDEWSTGQIESFAEMRGAAVFGGYAALSDLGEWPRELAIQWAIDDLRIQFGSERVEPVTTRSSLPRSRIYRPLTILALSVRQPAGPRLVWHALTGW